MKKLKVMDHTNDPPRRRWRVVIKSLDHRLRMVRLVALHMWLYAGGASQIEFSDE